MRQIEIEFAETIFNRDNWKETYKKEPSIYTEEQMNNPIVKELVLETWN